MSLSLEKMKNGKRDEGKYGIRNKQKMSDME